jgi:hypothetical protein
MMSLHGAYPFSVSHHVPSRNWLEGWSKIRSKQMVLPPWTTEIPQLQEHAMRITGPGRISAARLFLNELNQLLYSMTFWTAPSTRPGVIQKELNADEQALHDSFTKLGIVCISIFSSFRFADIYFQHLREAIEDCHSSMKHDVEQHLYKAFDKLISTASGSALEIAT